jgi:hypothetical protein
MQDCNPPRNIQLRLIEAVRGAGAEQEDDLLLAPGLCHCAWSRSLGGPRSIAGTRFASVSSRSLLLLIPSC